MIAALSLRDDPSPTWPDRFVALAGLIVWAAWGWYRYHRPHAPLWTDAVPIAVMLGGGVSTANALTVFGPSS